MRMSGRPYVYGIVVRWAVVVASGLAVLGSAATAPVPVPVGTPAPACVGARCPQPDSPTINPVLWP